MAKDEEKKPGLHSYLSRKQDAALAADVRLLFRRTSPARIRTSLLQLFSEYASKSDKTLPPREESEILADVHSLREFLTKMEKHLTAGE